MGMVLFPRALIIFFFPLWILFKDTNFFRSIKALNNLYIWCPYFIGVPQEVKKSASMTFQIDMLFQKYTGHSISIYSLIFSSVLCPIEP